jgi:hypothetical protein
MTRMAVVELSPDEGLIGRPLSTLSSLFETTRAILSEHGPAVAKEMLEELGEEAGCAGSKGE